MKLSILAHMINGASVTGDEEILSLCHDSRLCEKGALFFAMAGRDHGAHDYLDDALKRGAVAVVSESKLPESVPHILVPDVREAYARICAYYYGSPEKKLKVIGVTGTNGKTTTVHMIASVLAHAGYSVGVVGTLGTRYAGKFIAPELTTPDPDFLFSTFADMVDSGVEYVVMEVSAHALYYKKELPITYEVAVFTNFTQDHLDFFGNMETYGNAKRTLFSRERAKYTVVNSDDAFSKKLSFVGETYGLDEPSDTFAVVEEASLTGTRILCNRMDELLEVNLSLIGRHNVYNALSAFCVARKLGVPLQRIGEGLEQLKGVSGRLERVASYRGATVFIDFAHTPDGLEKSLSALKKHCLGRLFLVFGCGGNRDESKRPKMGEIAAKGCDFAVITSDNPRYEDPVDIISAVEKGYAKFSKRYVCVQDREKATSYALSHLERGDVLLIAGKGGECYQEIMGIKYPYDDKKIVEKLIGT